MTIQAYLGRTAGKVKVIREDATGRVRLRTAPGRRETVKENLLLRGAR
jgi:hypothetical protein